MSKTELPSARDREVQSLSPEARRREARALSPEARQHEPQEREAQTLRTKVVRHVGPGTRAFDVAKRTVVGTYNDGFIHAGNLAYLAMLAIFPFFIIGAALFAVIGSSGDEAAIIDVIVASMPPTVAKTIAPVARDVMEARSGWLLWAGAVVALWTVTSLIETIRDILRRAYGTEATRAFWKYRLISAGFTLAAIILLVLSLFSQVLIGAAQEVIRAYFPQLVDSISALRLSRIVPTIGLFGSLYLLFYTLTPTAYRARRYPKWPGVVFITLWWLFVTSVLPPILGTFFAYNLTYGSLAGIMIALFFFWLVGLGMVVGAELNAALAITPEEEEADASGEEEREDSEWAV